MLTITKQGNFKPFGRSENRLRQNLLVAVWLCLAGVVSTPAQTTSTGSVVLVRNVRVADESSGKLVKATVLVSGGKMTRVETDAPLPDGAVEIDGGGNVLSLGANGKIILRADVKSAVLEYEWQPPIVDPAVTLAAGEINQPTPAIYPKDPLNIVPVDSRRNEFSTLGNSGARLPKAYVANADRDVLKTFSERPGGQQQAPQDNLAGKVVDPSAGLSTVTFQNKYTPSLWGIDDDENEFNVQAVVPYHLGGKLNIFRATVPFLTNTPAPGNNGLGDVALLNLTILPQDWGNFLIGPVATFGTNKGPGVDTFAIGPSVGAVLKKGKWTYGVLNQNLFSFGGDIKTTQLQPILAYTVSEKISLALGDVQYTIDWNKEKFVTAPVSGQINYIQMFGKQPVRLFFNAQYNFLNDFGQRKWTLSPGFALILR